VIWFLMTNEILVCPKARCGHEVRIRPNAAAAQNTATMGMGSNVADPRTYARPL
jgi:hypothetical protein